MRDDAVEERATDRDRAADSALEIEVPVPPEMPLSEVDVQNTMLEVAEVLAACRDLLLVARAGLDLSADADRPVAEREAIERGESPPPLTELLAGCLDCATTEWLPTATRSLRQAASWKEEEIARAWAAATPGPDGALADPASQPIEDDDNGR